MAGGPPATSQTKMDKPDRLARCGAAGTGDPGDRDGNIGVRMGEGPLGHGQGNLFAYGPMLCQEGGIDAVFASFE